MVGLIIRLGMMVMTLDKNYINLAVIFNVLNINCSKFSGWIEILLIHFPTAQLRGEIYIILLHMYIKGFVNT